MSTTNNNNNNNNNRKIKLPLKIIQDENRLTINLIDSKTNSSIVVLNNKCVETSQFEKTNLLTNFKEKEKLVVDLDKIETISGENKLNIDNELGLFLSESFQKDKTKSNEKNNRHLRDIIIESGDNWSHFLLPFIRFGELKNSNITQNQNKKQSSSRKLMDQFNKVRQQYEQKKTTFESSNRKTTSNPNHLSSKFFNFNRILNRRRSQNSIVNSSAQNESEFKKARSASSTNKKSLNFNFRSCCNSKSPKSAKNKRLLTKEIDLIRSSPTSPMISPPVLHQNRLLKLFKLDKKNIEQKLIKNDSDEDDYDNVYKNLNTHDKISTISNHSPPITVATSTNKSRSNVDLFKMLKSSSSTGSAQTTAKLDALKFEIDRTMNEISLFKQNSHQQNSLLYTTYHQQLLEIDRLLSNFNKFNSTINNCKKVNDIGVNTDISMLNATFTIKYNESLAGDENGRQSLAAKKEEPIYQNEQIIEEEKFYFKPIKQKENIEFSFPHKMNKMQKTTKIKSKNLIMLSSGMPAYVESPDTTLSNSNPRHNNSINNTNSNSRTSDQSVYRHKPAAIGLLDETSSLTTTTSNSNTVDDLKKIKKMYNMMPNIKRNSCNYCQSRHLTNKFNETATTMTTSATSENENSNDSSSLDSINYSSQNKNKKYSLPKNAVDTTNSNSSNETRRTKEFISTAQPLTKLPIFDFGKNKPNSNNVRNCKKNFHDNKIQLKILPLKISSSSNSNINRINRCNCCYCVNNHLDNHITQDNKVCSQNDETETSSYQDYSSRFERVNMNGLTKDKYYLSDRKSNSNLRFKTFNINKRVFSKFDKKNIDNNSEVVLNCDYKDKERLFDNFKDIFDFNKKNRYLYANEKENEDVKSTTCSRDLESDDLIYIDQDEANKNDVVYNYENDMNNKNNQRKISERLNKEVEDLISKENIEMTLKTFRRPHSAIPSADNLISSSNMSHSKLCASDDKKSLYINEKQDEYGNNNMTNDNNFKAIRFPELNDSIINDNLIGSSSQKLLKFMVDHPNCSIQQKKQNLNKRIKKQQNRYLIHYPVKTSSVNGSSSIDDNDLDMNVSEVGAGDANSMNNSFLYDLNGDGLISNLTRRHVTKRQIHVNYNKTQFNTVMLKSYRLN